MRWLVRRLILAFVTIYVAVTLTFFIVRAMPGDPIDALTQELIAKYYMSAEEARKLAEALAPYLPRGSLIEQYFSYIANFFMGNLGVSISYSTGTPVTAILGDAIPWTVLVVGTALLISFTFGGLLGMAMAYTHGSKFDSALSVTFAILKSIPEYIAGIVILWVFGFQLGWFPTRGRYDAEALEALEHGNYLYFIGNVLWHAALPIMAWLVVNMGWWALTMRGSTVSVLGEDFVAYAAARGLPKRRVVVTYVGRNAILPLFTSFMLGLGFMFGGSIFIEYIFSYSGAGWVLYQAITNRDWFLAIGAFDVIVVAVVTGALIADLLYGVLDPRVRRPGT